MTPPDTDLTSITDVAEGRARLDAIDAGIRSLLAQRIAVSHHVQNLRVAEGQTRIQHARENLVIAGYVDELGRPGADIAMAVLTLCRGPIR